MAKLIIELGDVICKAKELQIAVGARSNGVTRPESCQNYSALTESRGVISERDFSPSPRRYSGLLHKSTNSHTRDCNASNRCRITMLRCVGICRDDGDKRDTAGNRKRSQRMIGAGIMEVSAGQAASQPLTKRLPRLATTTFRGWSLRGDLIIARQPQIGRKRRIEDSFDKSCTGHLLCFCFSCPSVELRKHRYMGLLIVSVGEQAKCSTDYIQMIRIPRAHCYLW